MHISTDDHIITKIRNSKSKKFFFIDDFITISNYKAVNKALERLVKRGVLTRVAKGIYARPKIDPLLGEMLPTTEQIAEAIAKRDKARIIPTGAYALHMLGLSTQIPMNVVYLTDSSARKVKVGERTIVFKKTSPRNLAVKGKISSLAIQALKTIGKDKVSDADMATIIKSLKKENPTVLKYDITYAPEWIRKIMKQAL